MHTGVDLRMPLLRLRHTEQAIHFGENHFQCAAVAQHFEEYLRRFLAQRALGLLPYPFRHQRGDLSGLDHRAHQRARGFMHGESQWRETCGKTRDAQHAHRILGECRRHVPQHPCSQIHLAAIRIDQRPIRGLRDGIDRQIPPQQVFLERDVGRELGDEAAVARCGLALRARQAGSEGFGMQNTEIEAHRG